MCVVYACMYALCVCTCVSVCVCAVKCMYACTFLYAGLPMHVIMLCIACVHVASSSPSTLLLHLQVCSQCPLVVFSLLSEGLPLDMSQYSRLFYSTCSPHQHKDELVTFQDSRHVVVLRRGHFYKVEALQRDRGVAYY